MPANIRNRPTASVPPAMPPLLMPQPPIAPLIPPGQTVDLMTALLLGLVHGITPAEHTWPITFSYAVGGYSTWRGTRRGEARGRSSSRPRSSTCSPI